MALTFAPRTAVHPDRSGAVKRGPNRLIVLHTTEGGEGDNAAENLASFTTAKGDRPNGDGTFYGSSYAYVVDTDRVIPLVPENVVSYSAPGANNDGIHIVFPGRVSQSRTEWLDNISDAYIVNCALLMQDISRRTGIPLVRLTVAEVLAGKSGYCDHWTISQAYKRSTHTDLGTNFPWDRLLNLLKPAPPVEVPATRPAPVAPEQPQSIDPSEEDDMPNTAYLWQHPAYGNIWLCGVGAADHQTPKSAELLRSRGVETVVERHEQKLTQCLHQSGLDRSALVPTGL